MGDQWQLPAGQLATKYYRFIDSLVTRLRVSGAAGGTRVSIYCFVSFVTVILDRIRQEESTVDLCLFATQFLWGYVSQMCSFG